MAQILDTVGPWLVAGLLYGVPFALAWWLSDGFANVTFTMQEMHIGPAFNPHTQETGYAWLDSNDLPIGYIS